MMQRDGLGGVAALVMALACGARVEERGAVTPSAVQRAEARAPDLQRIERGRYLVEHVAACPDCHSPRRGHDDFDRERWLSGVDCFVDAAPDDPSAGCLATANLTDHETGLKNRTDQQIKDMFTVPDIVRALKHGEDKDQGERLCPPMPAGPRGSFGGMTDTDATDIAHYLLSLPPRDHRVPYDCSRGAEVGTP